MAGTKEGSKSKSGKKKRKSQEYALTDVQLEGNESVEGDLNAYPSSPVDLPSASNPHPNSETMPTKNKRGPTKLKGLGIDYQNERVEVEFNERGQPVGDSSVSLATFCGALVRASVPISVPKWGDVPKQQKENLWTIVVQRYKLDEVNKKGTLGKMATYLREYRARVGRSVRAAIALETEEANLQLAKLKPTNLTDRDWEDFMKRACSVSATTKSDFMRIIRSFHKLPHSMSRQGYARLEHKMRKENPNCTEIPRVDLWAEGHKAKKKKPATAAVVEALKKIQEIKESQSGTQSSVSLNDDALSKVLRKDQPGRTVMGLGFGVTLGKLSAQTHATKMMHVLQGQFRALEEKFDKVLQAQQGGNRSGQQGDNRSGAENVQPPQVVITSESQHDSNTNEPYIGQKCKIMSWYNKGEIVAEGSIACANPNSQVHCRRLGLDAWSVWVEVALVPDAELWRSTSEATCIQQAQGSTVAWSKQYILLDT